MDTGLTLKPAVTVAPASDVRSDPAVRNAVTTELDPEKTVKAPEPAGPTLASDNSRMREVILDPHSREVIYRVVDVRSRRVIWQVPEEAMLRLRAYTRAELNALDKKNSQSSFDSTA